MSQGSILEAQHLSKRFGGLLAVRDYTLSVKPGEVVGLIGPNGAGKTTVLNLLTGLETPTRGRVLFRGRPITGATPQDVARRGLARTFQNLRLFGELSVRDNVRAALLVRKRYTVTDVLLRRPRFVAGEAQLQDEADALLGEVGLSDEANLAASALPYGKQRQLEVARALALKPQLLLLDEPAAGMVDAEQKRLAELLRRVQQGGLTLVVIDHNIRFLLSIVDRVQVMNYGEQIAEGTPDEIVNNPLVIEAYLGREDASEGASV